MRHDAVGFFWEDTPRVARERDPYVTAPIVMKDGELLCPVCGYNYIHRGHSQGDFISIQCEAKDMHGGVYHPPIALCVETSKGNTQIYWRIGPEDDEAKVTHRVENRLPFPLRRFDGELTSEALDHYRQLMPLVAPDDLEGEVEAELREEVNAEVARMRRERRRARPA